MRRRTFEQPSHRDEHDGQHDSDVTTPWTSRLPRPRLPADHGHRPGRGPWDRHGGTTQAPDGRCSPASPPASPPGPLAPRPRTPAPASRRPPPPTRAPTASPTPTANPRTRVSPRATPHRSPTRRRRVRARAPPRTWSPTPRPPAAFRPSVTHRCPRLGPRSLDLAILGWRLRRQVVEQSLGGLGHPHAPRARTPPR